MQLLHLIKKINSTIFWCKEKKQNDRDNTERAESLIFIVVPKQSKPLKLFSTTYWRRCSYKDSDNRYNSNNSDNDKDNISDHGNNSNMKVT